MSRIIVTTDTHLNHERIKQFGRPDDFEERIRREHRSIIKSGDIVIHLGDVCIHDPYEAHQRLFREIFPSGITTVLVRGNHDNKSYGWYTDRGWDIVVEALHIKCAGKRVLLTHKPAYKQEKIDINVHGHTHGNTHRNIEHDVFYDPTYHKEVALENTGYKPIILEKWIQQNT